MAQKNQNKQNNKSNTKQNESRKGKNTAPKNKAEQASAKSHEDFLAEQNRVLTIRLVCGTLLAILGFLTMLSFVGIQGLLLDVLKKGVGGLFGYGFYLFWIVCLFSAFVLIIRFGKGAVIRCCAAFLTMFSVGGLMHLSKEPMAIPQDIGLIGHLWGTGANLSSGGVLIGGFAHGARLLISKPGTVMLLLVCLCIGLVFTFKVPVRRIIHNRAEVKSQKLEEARKELPEPQPISTRETIADISVLTTPVEHPAVRISRTIQRTAVERSNSRQKDPREFDIQLDGEPPRRKKTPKALTVAEEAAPVPQVDVNQDMPFVGGRKKVMRVKPVERNRSDFNVPMDAPETGADYTNAVQELVRTEQTDYCESAESWTSDIQDTVPFDYDNSVAVPETSYEEPVTPVSMTRPITQLTDEDISQGIREAEDSKTLKPGEADAEEEEIYRDISEAAEKKAQTYHYPTTAHLSMGDNSSEDTTEETRRNIQLLEDTLSSFGVDIKVSGRPVRGPSVTRYEMKLPLGTKMSKITSLAEDLALSLGVASVRIAAVTGKTSTIGIEVPNTVSTSVPIGSILNSSTFTSAKSKLAFAVGKDISGDIIVGDIAKMPHLLIAGTTGSGKSVCMNSIIVSLLYHSTPEQVRMIMIDPKVVELSVYNGIPHLLIPVVTDPKKAAGALQWAVTEMERRYSLLAEYNVRDLAGYNKQASSNDNMEPLPQIVVIIDELADLMMVAAKDIENSIVRIAQKARAAGMHLIIATQRPSANVITGLMKSNIPSRIAFAVSSAVDSRIILDVGGAEKLLGKGDMLFAPIGAGNPKRIQGCFITDGEVEAVVAEVKQSQETIYDESISAQIDQNAAAADGSQYPSASVDDGQTALTYEGDELLPDAVEVVLDTKQASVSMLQRRLRLGYAHAARIVDEMEEKGIVGPFEGSKPRQLLITREQWDHMVGINPKATPVSDSGIPMSE